MKGDCGHCKYGLWCDGGPRTESVNVQSNILNPTGMGTCTVFKSIVGYGILCFSGGSSEVK